MDETGHSGNTGSLDGGSGADSHDRTLLNGWATSRNPWSNAGAALDSEDDDVPAWRRPSQEVRPFTRQVAPPEHQSGEIRYGDPSQSGEIRYGDPGRSSDVRAPDTAPAPEPVDPPSLHWSDSRTRYSDLLSHFTSMGTEPTGSPVTPPRFDALTRPGSLEDAPAPSSAPPYPYEGDLDDVPTPSVGTWPRAAVPADQPRESFPAVGPATPGGRGVDWLAAAESARHALDPTPPEDNPRIEQAESSAEPIRVRPSYDPSTFPRRLPNDTAQSSWALPQRIPAEPDVPTVPEPPTAEASAETPALARIATHLRRGDVLSAEERQEGFDVNAILEAVREVGGVRDASLRTTPAGAHSLRLDLAEGADPAEVSRHVARLLQDRMGLDAAMQGGENAPPPAHGSAPVPPAQPSTSPPASAFVPSQAGPTGRATVTSASMAVPGEGLRRLPTAPQAGPAPVAAEESSAPAAAADDLFADGLTSAVDLTPHGVERGRPRPLEVNERPGPRVMIENVQVNTFGTEATVQVRLAVAGRTAAGVATGPAVDGYLLRLCALATAHAVDQLLTASDHVDGPARCFVEHAASVPFGSMHVAVVVLLLSCGGWVEQLAGSAVVNGDDRHAMVRATLAAVNRRLEALLS